MILRCHYLFLAVDIICIGLIRSYPDRNVCHILHIYSYSVNGWFIIYFPVLNLIYFYVPSFFLILILVSEYELNTNPIWIYVHTFLTLTNASFYFPPFYFSICMVYQGVEYML